MVVHRPRGSGCAIALLVLFVPAILVSYLSHSLIWLIVMPFGIVLLFLILAAATSSSKRRVTPEQSADELERHLLGTEGPMDWDDVT